jgi:hypothetical protein
MGYRFGFHLFYLMKIVISGPDFPAGSVIYADYRVGSHYLISSILAATAGRFQTETTIQRSRSSNPKTTRKNLLNKFFFKLES